MSMYEKKYLIDGEPSSARDVIKMASEYDPDFAEGTFLQTSVASGILRDNGISVEENLAKEIK